MTAEDIKALSPKAGAKFSPNLYRWLVRRARYRNLERIGVFRAVDGRLFVGSKDDTGLVSGAPLWTVMHGGAQNMSFCYLGSQGWRELKTFWREYAKRGRCHVDPKHEHTFVDERWETCGNRRTCLWCGTKQRRVAKRRTVVEHSWVEVARG